MGSPSRDATQPDVGAPGPGVEPPRRAPSPVSHLQAGPDLFSYSAPVITEIARKLRDSLSRLSVDVDLETLSEAMRLVLQDSAGLSAEPLTSGERDYLLEHTDLERSDLDGAGRDATRAAIVRSRATADQSVHERSMSTAEVTELTGRPDSSIRRSARRGELYVLNPGDSRGLRFPRWQFIDSTAVPGLDRIIAALPEGTHPLLIERFMTGVREPLDGRSPRDWLATGGDVEQVVRLAEDKGRE